MLDGDLTDHLLTVKSTTGWNPSSWLLL